MTIILIGFFFFFAISQPIHVDKHEARATLFKTYQESLIFASEASNVNFQKKKTILSLHVALLLKPLVIRFCPLKILADYFTL